MADLLGFLLRALVVVATFKKTSADEALYHSGCGTHQLLVQTGDEGLGMLASRIQEHGRVLLGNLLQTLNVRLPLNVRQFHYTLPSGEGLQGLKVTLKWVDSERLLI